MSNETPSYPTRQEWATALNDLRARLMRERARAFAPGSRRKCPTCGKRTLTGTDDIMREMVVGALAVVHHNLHGARCSHCGTEMLEAYEEIALEEGGQPRRLTDYQAKVTSVSGRNLGTYWPKDLVRVMDLHKEDALFVRVLDEDTMVIERRHDHD